MRPTLLALLAALLVAGCVEDEADKLLKQRYPADSAGVAVAVVRDGSVLYSRAFGLAEVEHRVPVAKETMFDVASASKQFTAFALFSLVSQGLLQLDDPIDPYVTDIFPAAAGQGITIRHLLSHTSGIRDYVWAITVAGRRFDDVHTVEDAHRYLTHQKGLQQTPGQTFVYNNTGYLLLAAIIEKKGGKKFAAYMKQDVFGPLGMTSSFFLESPELVVPNRARAYSTTGGEFCYGSTPGGVLERCINSTALPGPASLMTTLADMTTWLTKVQRGVAGGDPRFVQLFTASTMRRPILTDCGAFRSDKAQYAGGMYLDEISGFPVACHGGTWRGFRAMELFVPGRKLAVVILSNRGDELGYLRDTAFALIKLFEPSTGLSVPAMPPEHPNVCLATAATDLDGRYYSAELETTYTFKRDASGHLIASSLRRDDVRLCQSDNPDRFESEKFWLYRARFKREEGEVKGVEISARTAAGSILFTKLP